MKSASLRSGLAIIALISVAACSAVGGGNTSALPSSVSAPVSGNTIASPDHHRHPRPPSKKKQLTLASAALSVAGGSINLNQFGSSNGWLMQFLHFGHDVAHTRGHSQHTASGPSCQNGVEYTWSSSGTGQVSQTIEFFYDAACTQPFILITLNATYTAAGGHAAGTQETWDQSGNVVSYQTLNVTFANGVSGIGEIVVEKTTAPNPSAPPTSTTGYTCLLHTSNAVDCGAGNVTDLPLASPSPEEVGFTQTVVGAFETPSPAPSCPASGSGSNWGEGGGSSPCCPASGSDWSSGSGSQPCCPGSGGDDSVSGSSTPSPSPSPSTAPSCAPSGSGSGDHTGPNWGHGRGHGWGNGWGQPDGLVLTINGTGYTGALNALTLAAGTPPTWTITGGTEVDTLTGTATIGFGGYEGHGHGWHHGHTAKDWGHGNDPGGCAMTSIDLTLNDTADGLTVTITNATSHSHPHWGGGSGSGSGSNNPLTGTVTETGTTTVVATMSLDYSGTGTITYSNGSVSQVQDWIIVN